MEHNYPENIYLAAKKSGSHAYIFKILRHLTILEITKNNFEKAIEYCIEGYSTAKLIKKETEFYTFASMLYYLKTGTGENDKYKNDRILKFYHKIKKTHPSDTWTIYLENSLVMTYYPKKRKEIFQIFREQINSYFLHGDYSFAAYWRFILDSENCDDKILFHFKLTNNYLLLDKINEKLIDEAENICINTLACYKELNNIGFIWEVYKLQLKAMFFREDSFDFESAILIVNKMEWLKKRRKKVSALNAFELLKLSVRMLDQRDHPKYLLDKYEHKFKKLVNSFKQFPREYNIIDYAIISSLARRLKCKEIIYIVMDLYNWLLTNHPEILEPVFREFKERESKIYTVSGAA
jgi:hypothetical protein